MILNLGSLAFNADIETPGGNPAWGTELGQGEGYKFVFEDMSDFFTGMVYMSVSDTENVTCPLGKGGNHRADYDFVIASLFDKVYVNGKRVKNGRFILLVVKKLNGDHHVGRRTIKYNPRMTYRDEYINEDCYKKMASTMGLPEDAAWFVYEIYIKHQDQLHFTAFELGQEPQTYRNNDERKNAFISKLPKDGKRSHFVTSLNEYSFQEIFYGAPGTGKSHEISRLTEGEDVIRTTFHPDSDYSTFVGCYKPTMKENVISKNGVETKEEQIVYRFIPQAFSKAYVAAWKSEDDVFLIIEEINRGNCAQIFGDLFQLLDRGSDGFSEYPIDADTDLGSYISNELKKSKREDIPNDIREGKKLVLPSNFYIWATMNTSDQSLFPIDSAFKRRWDWKYVKIKDEGKGWKVDIDIKVKENEEETTKKLDWGEFISKINEIIASMTSSADKQLGYFFCKPKTKDSKEIDAETFVSKVIFYLWNDVFKDYAFEDASLFQYTIEVNGNKETKDLTFPDFYNDDESINTTCLTDFIEKVMNWKKGNEDKE